MQNLPGARPHPLLGLMGRFDEDPGRYRPLYYGVKIAVGIAAGAVGRGSITINNQPYIMTRITTKIVGNTANPSVSGLYQDGQYDIEWKDEQSNYQNGPIPADLLFGSVASGYIIELAFPIAFAGNKTLSFTLTNQVNRAVVPQVETFEIAVALHGVADWGTLGPRG